MLPDPPDEATSWRVIAAGIVIAFCGLAWFVISAFVMKASITDSLGEALGVALGFLVAFSVVGAVLDARRSRP